MSEHSKRSLILFLVTIFGAAFMRGLGGLDIQSSAAQYIALPYIVTLLILIFVRPHEEVLRRRYALITRDSLLAFLGISLIFFEGFICVLFFLPIYFMMIGCVFITEHLWRRYQAKKDSRLLSHAFPAFIIIASLEGTHPNLSFERTHVVEVSGISTQSAEALRKNLLSEIQLPESRHWLLSVFPLPYHIEADTFEDGAVHTAYFSYKRWFVANEHKGKMSLRLQTQERDKVVAHFISDDSYLSTYLNFKKSEFSFIENADGTTQINLKITFQRNLDPYWYFGPLERFAMTQTAHYIINNMVLKNAS